MTGIPWMDRTWRNLDDAAAIVRMRLEAEHRPMVRKWLQRIHDHIAEQKPCYESTIGWTFALDESDEGAEPITTADIYLPCG